MLTPNKTLLQQALEAIFDTKANAMGPTLKFAAPTVRVTLSVITPSQFQALADLGQYLGQQPTLVRSGANIAVVFAC